MSDCMYIPGRRVFLVLLTSGVAISSWAWALFPSTVESGIYVPLPETSTRSAADVNSARQGVAGNPLELSRANAFRLMDAELETSKPTMYGSATAWYPSPVANVSQVSVRSKLQALLMMLHSQSGVVDPAALEAKLQALLTLPDSVLAQLMEHPDLADLNKTLDAVFLGTSDLSGVKTELDKIDVTSVPGPSEKIDVVKVNDKPAYIVHASAVQMRTEDAAGSPVSALPPPPGAPVTVTVLSLVQAPASLSASTFTVVPTSQQLPPPPAPAAQSASTFTVAPTSQQLAPPRQIMSVFTVAPTSQQLAPPPAPARQIMSAFTVAPTSQQLAPPPTPTSTPTATTPTASVKPTGTAKTSNDDLNSGTTNNSGSTTTKGGSTTTNGGSTTTNGGSTTTNGGSTTTNGGSTTTNGGSTTTNGGSTTTKGGSTTTKGGSTTTKGGSTTNKGGHTGNTNDGAKKDADKGEK